MAELRRRSAGLQFVERHAWIPSIGAEYLVGIDGLSLLLVILTSLVFPFAFLAQRMSRGACALLLVMQAALYGTFTAQNFILWFLFYEMSLIPGVSPHQNLGRRESRPGRDEILPLHVPRQCRDAALVSRHLFWQRHVRFREINGARRSGPCSTASSRWIAFAGIFLGLAVKVPLFPFHTWLPDAYETAPIGVSMVLTGVLSKMGVYGFMRLLLPLFPREIQVLGPWLLGLAVCSIVFASLAAWAQSDLKRMVAYLSINHLGYCMLGLFAVSATHRRGRPSKSRRRLSGVFLQIFNHGITAAALFYFVGLLEERRGLARHPRFRRPDATHPASLRLDERRHVFLTGLARA